MEKATIPGPGNGAGEPVDEPRMPPASGPNTGGEHERHVDPRTMEQGVTTIPETDAAADGFPEGGREALTVLFGSWCVLLCTYGLGNSIGVFQTYYVNDALREYSSSTVSWITSFMQWTMNFLPIIVR